MNIYGVIMAGGGGTRFWPLSRQEKPKQILNLSGKDTMIGETVSRLSLVVPKEDIFIVTNEAQRESILFAVGGRIAEDHIMLEPVGRNTAACIGYAAFEVLEKYGDGILVITPSDAYIRDVSLFAETLKTAVRVALSEDKLVTIGIEPTFPATGYGYMEYDMQSEVLAKPVLEFKEKPDRATAEVYLKRGNYVWNSGMFIWKASTILGAFQKYLPDIYQKLSQIAEHFGRDTESEVLKEIYPQIRSISIDYGIMEKADNVVVIPAEFGWSDVGSWDMFGVLHEKDKYGNIIIGNQINIDTTNTVSYAKNKMVATIGVDNLVIVDTEDALLVCSAKEAQRVKEVVEVLKDRGYVDLV